jgi:hypothetical protein
MVSEEFCMGPRDPSPIGKPALGGSCPGVSGDILDLTVDGREDPGVERSGTG